MVLCCLQNRLRARENSSWRRSLLLGPLALLLVTNAPRFGLIVTDFLQINPQTSSSERVCPGVPAVFLIGSSEPPEERVEASPRLAERAWAWSRRAWEAKEGASLVVHLGLAKLVLVAEEVEDMHAGTCGKRDRRPVTPQILAEGVPIPALLVLVAA